MNLATAAKIRDLQRLTRSRMLGTGVIDRRTLGRSVSRRSIETPLVLRLLPAWVYQPDSNFELDREKGKYYSMLVD